MTSSDVTGFIGTGFIGLGRMGEPMAVNLLRAGRPLVVWARNAERVRGVQRLGAIAAAGVAELWNRCDTILFMLTDASAFEDVLGWDGSGFAYPMADRTLVNLGTIAPASAAVFHRRITSAGGRYVEAPVSGSRIPAERGELVLMLAGEQIDGIEELLRPIYSSAVRCGEVPRATGTKLAVNAFLVSLVTTLAEALHLAERSGIDLEVLQKVIDAGPMASDVSTIKLAKMLSSDYEPQAAVDDVAYNCRLILQMASEAGAATPLARLSHDLYQQASALGLGGQDMAAVVEALRLSSRQRS